MFILGDIYFQYMIFWVIYFQYRIFWVIYFQCMIFWVIYRFFMFFREKLDAEASVSSPGGRSSMPKTRALVVALLERLNLLLTVTIAPEGAVHITRSFSITPETNKPRKNSLSSID